MTRSSSRLVQRGGIPIDRPSLTNEGAVQAFVFQQFLMLQLLIPATGAMAFAGYSLIGEKQGRTLEPLLATPITTPELLIGKGLGALLPSFGDHDRGDAALRRLHRDLRAPRRALRR